MRFCYYKWRFCLVSISNDSAHLRFWLCLSYLFLFNPYLFFLNPFEVTNLIHSDGKGINPLLRHPGMYIHPPLLMSGLASISIPFVISQGALFDYKKGNNWFKLLRIWSLISWALLGAGLLIGAWWAYTILGWGGYWSWDPIENGNDRRYLFAGLYWGTPHLRETTSWSLSLERANNTKT